MNAQTTRALDCCGWPPKSVRSSQYEENGVRKMGPDAEAHFGATAITAPNSNSKQRRQIISGASRLTSLSSDDRQKRTPENAEGGSAMIYQRSLDIERRLQAVLRLIRSGHCSTPMIAQQVGVSIPTISRDVTALRERGYNIRSERGDDGWRYLLASESPKLLRSMRAVPAET
jgi:biotin operon repressor